MLVGMLAVDGCSIFTSCDDRMASWFGKPIHRAIDQLGEPESTSPLRNDYQSYEWSYQSLSRGPRQPGLTCSAYDCSVGNREAPLPIAGQNAQR